MGLIPMTRSGSVGTHQPQHKPVTVLVVDDVGEVRDVTKRMLERAGYAVLTAVDGLDATKVFCRHESDIDVVLLDLMMPELDGVEVVRVMRGVYEEAKIILVTAYPEHVAADRWRELGFAGFLLKPFTSAQLLEVVRNALEG
jgi:CheY-like chemotaxis protein